MLDRSWHIECHALILPALTAQDEWSLICMTTGSRNQVPRTTQDRLVARAYGEVGEG
ncbi:MAG: hypothetical protein WCO04_00525 [Pseudomonadota bacterium]